MKAKCSTTVPFLNHTFDPRPKTGTAIWRTTTTEQQHDADKGNLTTTATPAVDGLFAHGWGHGRGGCVGHGQCDQEGRVRGKEREEKRYNCIYYRRVRMAYWQGRGNSEYDPEPDEDMLSPRLARALLGPVPDTKTND